MDNLGYLLGPAAACAVMMLVCMRVMARGHRDSHSSGSDSGEIAALRAEVEELRAERTSDRAVTDR